MGSAKKKLHQNPHNLVQIYLVDFPAAFYGFAVDIFCSESLVRELTLTVFKGF